MPWFITRAFFLVAGQFHAYHFASTPYPEGEGRGKISAVTACRIFPGKNTEQ